ncbi:MAG: hypothetical protein B6244_07610 [Candidatus Cloacimonetes bacterium 4572_55]|nr:MAG: hypothetical protein B6244_07610 [Candidatus Cloacimonetes bacterium 4572_55]
MFEQHDYQPIVPYTFDNFVVGNSNRFAFAACRSVAQSPGTIYNPIFIHGGVGLGKTHLLCALGNYIREHDEEASVVYVTIDRLTKELMVAVENGNLDSFNNQFQMVDCILIDDIGFLKEREGIQQKIVHFFDLLVSRRKQIALTSDRPPRELNTLLERLRSRFEGGLIVDIQTPEFETRVAILQKKAEAMRIQDISDDVIYAIADHFRTNIRELEGALNKLIAYRSMLKKKITTNHLQDIFPNFSSSEDEFHQPAIDDGDETVLLKTPRPTEKSQVGADLTEFFEDFADGVTAQIAKREREMAEKEKFRRKTYIWQMKGFVTARLEKAMEKELEEIRSVFQEYTKDVNYLIDMQKNIACMDNAEGFNRELREIEDMLFDPDRINVIESRLNEIRVRVERRFKYWETLHKDIDIRDFIVSDSNRLAFTMTETTIKYPAQRFNPLFIHGQEDTGKTFLLHAIGNKVFHKHPPMYVCYIHAKDFISGLIKGIKDGTVSEFIQYYRDADFLIFDDIHLLRGKERTQEEFFHVFNSLIANNKQIVISSNRPPQYLLTFDERLRSRFKSGLVVEIGTMDRESKKQAVQSLFNRCNLTVSADLIGKIVDNTSMNLKEVTDIIERTLVDSTASGKKVTEEMIKNLVQEQEEATLPRTKIDERFSSQRASKISTSEIQRKLISDWPIQDDLIEWEF